MHQHLLVMTNLPAASIAQTIAQQLIEQKLAACANIRSGVTSIYRWQGKIEVTSECALLLKTTHANYDALSDALLVLHPYDVPGIIALPIGRGLPTYLKWVETETATEADPAIETRHDDPPEV